MTDEAVTSLNGIRIAFPGYLPFSPGSAIPFGGPQKLYQFYEDMNYVSGKHDIRFGGSYVRINDNRTFGAYENSAEDAGCQKVAARRSTTWCWAGSSPLPDRGRPAGQVPRPGGEPAGRLAQLHP